MSVSAHTPGPWKAEYSEGDEWEVLAGANLPIAYISGWAGRSIEANARLIAAAPDLLVALKECLESEERRRTSLKDGAPASAYSDARLARVRAAIAKAEGKP